MDGSIINVFWYILETVPLKGRLGTEKLVEFTSRWD